MSCTRPLVRTSDGRVYPLSAEDSWKDQLNIYSRTGEFIDVDGQRASIIRCGKCIGCQTDKAKEWSDRLVMESSLYKNNWFVTLTFNDEWLIKQCGMYKTLKTEHLQLFMKRLRRKFKNDKIRFFACGEYGDESKTARPHYHLILFNLNLPLTDLTWLRQTKQGNDLYTSKVIDECWSDPNTGESYGFNTCGSVTFESCGYVARYTMKKVYGNQGKEYYAKTHRKPPFLVMSRNPGLGHEFMIEHDWSAEPNILVSDGEKSHECPVPEYMERWIKKNMPDLAAERALIKRRLAFETMHVRMSQTDKTRSKYAETQEKVVKNRTLVLTDRKDL